MTNEPRHLDLVDRLRGQYHLPVDDGAGPLNGSMTFSRQFETPPIQHEAAAEIALLRGKLRNARDAFLNLRADADSWEEDIDGDEVNGRTVMTVNYHITIGAMYLAELAEALGIDIPFDQTPGAAIDAVIEAEASAHSPDNPTDASPSAPVSLKQT